MPNYFRRKKKRIQFFSEHRGTFSGYGLINNWMYHLLSTIISYLECNSSFGITSLERINDAQARTIQFCASWVSVCSKFVQMNETIINSITYSMCNIHIYDNYFKYFVYYLYFSNVIKHPLLTLNWSLYIYCTKEKHIFINFNLKENQKYLRNLGNFAKIPNHFDDFFFTNIWMFIVHVQRRNVEIDGRYYDHNEN